MRNFYFNLLIKDEKKDLTLPSKCLGTFMHAWLQVELISATDIQRAN